MPGALSGDFTPFGYLRNPAHRATSWTATSGGNLRTAPDRVGVEWVYPVGRDPLIRVGLVLETVVDGRACSARADFDALGLTSRYHSCLMVGFDWNVDGIRVAARYFLADPDALCVLVSLTNETPSPRRQILRVIGRVDSTDGVRLASDAGSLTDAPCPHFVLLDSGSEMVDAPIGPGEHRQVLGVLARGQDINQARQRARRAAESAETVCQRVQAEDTRFDAGCPTLSGDWPAHWSEGLHHDFQTTRLLIQPPGGVFKDVWPSWMTAWPRVVLAEGCLDMLRLAYANPALACRAVLSMFRDAPQPNVPCIFETGEYNMLAADGSRCGTSPAWCLPFLSLELLYARTLDRAWLAQLYPYASAYVRWWLEHRTDSDGWLVYRCSWESGEDGNPRLDPTGSGDADISGRVRPVELQATLAHAAGVLAFFAGQLGLFGHVPGWQAIHDTFRERTRRLFDAKQGRYRDWLVAEQRFSEPCPDRPYWGVDACRYSAQSLTPLLIGGEVSADEVWRHAGPPWTLWPSWTVSLVESAAAAGLYAGVGQLAFHTIDRVYRVTTRRELGSLERPMPGCSPEFWPADWRTYAGNDAYGWGATTANLLIRHLFGFKESRQTDGWVAELTPAFPAAMLQPGTQLSMRNLSYRGLSFDLAYAVSADGLQALLELHGQPHACTVEHIDAGPNMDAASTATRVYPDEGDGSSARTRHQFRVQSGERYLLRLDQA